MGSAVVDGNLHSNNGNSGQCPLLQASPKPLVTGSNEFRGDGPAGDHVDELVVPFRRGLQEAGYPAVLSSPPGLLLVGIIEIRALADGFPVGHFGHAGGQLHLIFPPHSFDVDLQVQFSHAADDGLPRLFFQVGLKGGIFLGKAGQGLAHTHLGLLISGLDGKRNDRRWHMHGSHAVTHPTIGEGITRGAVDAEQRGNAPGGRPFNLLHFIGVHPHQPSNLGTLAGAHVDNGIPFVESTLIESHVGELTVAADLELESEHHQGEVRSVLERHFRFILVEIASIGRGVGRTGQITADPIQQGLHPLVLVGRPHQHRCQAQRQGAAANGIMDQLVRNLPFEDRLGQFIREQGSGIQELFPCFLSLAQQVWRNIPDRDFISMFSLKPQGLHGDQIDHSLVARFEPQGQLKQHRILIELLAQLLHDAQWVGTGAVAFVDKRQPRHPVPLHLAIDRHRLRLHAANRAEHQNCSVQDPQRSLHFNGEVHMARGIDDIDG